MNKNKSVFFVIFIAFFSFSACTLNVNQPNANANSNTVAPTPKATSAAQARWSIVICSSRAKTVVLSAGPGENDSEVFATWKEGASPRVFDFPARVQNLTSVYFKGIGSENNQVETCVLFDGKPKKRIEFDDQEDALITSTDTDELDKCRCVN